MTRTSRRPRFVRALIEFGLLLLFIVSGLAACTTSVKGTKDSILPRNLKSMDEIYRDHAQKSAKRKGVAPSVAPSSSDLPPAELKKQIESRVDPSASCLYDETPFCEHDLSITEMKTQAETAVQAERAQQQRDVHAAVIASETDDSEWRTVGDTDVTELRRRALRRGSVDLEAYTRDAANELDSVFSTLPNPTLVMYVFPHLTNNNPVPGYSTKFKMYENDPYALPGEVATNE